MKKIFGKTWILTILLSLPLSVAGEGLSAESPLAEVCGGCQDPCSDCDHCCAGPSIPQMPGAVLSVLVPVSNFQRVTCRNSCSGPEQEFEPQPSFRLRAAMRAMSLGPPVHLITRSLRI